MVNLPATSAARERSLFDGEFLRKLERLELLARKVFRGLLRGEHTAARRGRGLEFSDFRRYRPGDDVRHIDWNIYSRLDRLFLKLYAAEEDLTLHVLIDTSASMGFGEPRKFDHARRLAAALAYIGLHNLDRVGIGVFADGLGAGLPAVKARNHIARVLDFLAALDCAGPTRFAAALRDFAGRVRHPGLVFLISDVLVADEYAAGIEALRGRGHDAVVIQVLAEEEIQPPLDGAFRLVDAELGGRLDVTVDAALRAHYGRAMAKHLAAIEAHCLKRGVGYLRTSTAIPFEDLVTRYLREGGLLQ